VLKILSAFSLLTLALAGPSARAAQAVTCKDLKSCAEAMFDLTGQRYVWDDKADREKLVMSPNVELTQENAELVFTALLDQVHLARLPIGDGKTFRILPGAERKEIEMPILDASFDKAPNFPKTWDWVTMRYKTKTRELPSFIEQAYRLHVPREARLQADFNSGYLIVSGATPVVRHMYEIVKGADVPLSAEVKKMQAAQEKKWAEQRKIELPKEKK
jgi:type II secretory pathway component GspD/PulD (secretin)